MRNKLLAALAATIFMVSGAGILPASAQDGPLPYPYEWWVAYETSDCSGDGIMVKNYSTLVILWGYGAIRSLRSFTAGKLRHCEYKLPYATENTQ